MENGKKVRRASRRKYHYIYKTTCLITGKYYIGMHPTDDLDDGYQGSGTILARSIRVHGKENHQTEILEFLPNRDELKKREAKLVNEDLLDEKLCMNLALGGQGGILNEEHHHKLKEGASNYMKSKWNEESFKEKMSSKLSERNRKYLLEGKWKTPDWTGKKHSEESKKKISEKAKLRTGDKNSQYGKCWITNGVESKKIYKGDTIPEGWKLGRVIKKKH